MICLHLASFRDVVLWGWCCILSENQHVFGLIVIYWTSFLLKKELSDAPKISTDLKIKVWEVFLLPLLPLQRHARVWPPTRLDQLPVCKGGLGWHRPKEAEEASLGLGF